MIIHRYITHVLSKGSDEPILNDYEGKINPQIDKKIATKMLKNRILKTNTGIKISAKLDYIRNNLNFIIKENENGTYDFIVKNVEFVEVN